MMSREQQENAELEELREKCERLEREIVVLKDTLKTVATNLRAIADTHNDAFRAITRVLKI